MYIDKTSIELIGDKWIEGKEKPEKDSVLNSFNFDDGIHAKDLAKTCLKILCGDSSENISKNGMLYHYSNEGVTSWYDFAKEIMKLGELHCKVYPIETKDYPTLVKRPQYSVLNKSKIKTDFNIQIPYWRDSLAQCIERLKSN